MNMQIPGLDGFLASATTDRWAEAVDDAASDIYAELIALRPKSLFRHVSDDDLRDVADWMAEKEIDRRGE